MTPHVRVGDVVIDRGTSPRRVHVGDVITFVDPTGKPKTITHRIIAVIPSGKRVLFTTKGDANSNVERFTMPAEGRVGLVLYRVPRVGYVLLWVRRPIGRVVLIALPALVLLGLELGRLWGRT
jgi:signal peptidase I